ncbi:MAG: DNA repair protein RecN [Pseudomonadota bacterium]
MLTHIRIQQFTVVDKLEVDFSSGLTVITGETGAGKSITLDALALCLGDRADPTAIRPGYDRAEICAQFDVSGNKAARRWLIERDLDADDECLLRRVLTREGRSRAYINGTPATLQDCAALGQHLVDIHSQHAHQSLLRREHQRSLLDTFAGAAKDAEATQGAARSWREIDEQLQSLRASHRESADREQLLRYQVGELDELALTDGELATLEAEQRQLENADTIQRQASNAIELCEAQESGVHQALQSLDPELHEGKAIDNVREMLDSAAIQLEEARSELSHYLAARESNPARLEEVRGRLESIYALARKHRVMPEALQAHHKALADEFAALDSSDERIEALEADLQRAMESYQSSSASLTAARQKAATRLEKAVAKLLKKLSMGNCEFRVALEARSDGSPHPLGEEEIELRIATNPGAEPQSLAKIASGGELSRISLAIQVATAGRATVPSMIFDEVDVGIGGAVAEVVGRLLADMAGEAQVLCVTHLPQVAAQGAQHLMVTKTGRGKQLASSIADLAEADRVEELSRMLGGVTITESTRTHAREMLESGRGSGGGKQAA